MLSEEKDLLVRLDERMAGALEKLDEIHTQTIKTNGRVYRLESFNSYVKGGSAVVAFFITTLIACVLSIFSIIYE